MQCLYCQKRLGIFASKKRQFCSQLHEDWYQEEQSGSAIRRLLDPLTPAEYAAVQSTPKPVVVAPAVPEAPAITADPVEEQPAPASTVEPPTDLQPYLAQFPVLI